MGEEDGKYSMRRRMFRLEDVPLSSIYQQTHKDIKNPAILNILLRRSWRKVGTF